MHSKCTIIYEVKMQHYHLQKVALFKRVTSPKKKDLKGCVRRIASWKLLEIVRCKAWKRKKKRPVCTQNLWNIHGSQNASRLGALAEQKTIFICERRRRELKILGIFTSQAWKNAQICTQKVRKTHESANAPKSPSKKPLIFGAYPDQKRILVCERRRRELKILGIFTSKVWKKCPNMHSEGAEHTRKSKCTKVTH